MARVWKVVALSGGLVAIGVAILQATIFGPQAEVERLDAKTTEEIDRIVVGHASAQQKVHQIEQEIGKLHRTQNREHAASELAVLYEQLGQARVSSGDLVAAEDYFKRGTELDSSNPDLMADLAALYERFAQTLQTVDNRQLAYQQSVDWWSHAAAAADRDTNRRNKYLEAEGRTYDALANELLRAGRYQDADQATRNGLAVAPSDSSIYRQLDAHRAKLAPTKGQFPTTPPDSTKG
jgi:tetratricopeptide (TPR) repeat protein